MSGGGRAGEAERVGVQGWAKRAAMRLGSASLAGARAAKERAGAERGGARDGRRQGGCAAGSVLTRTIGRRCGGDQRLAKGGMAGAKGGGPAALWGALWKKGEGPRRPRSTSAAVGRARDGVRKQGRRREGVDGSQSGGEGRAEERGVGGGGGITVFGCVRAPRGGTDRRMRPKHRSTARRAQERKRRGEQREAESDEGRAPAGGRTQRDRVHESKRFGGGGKERGSARAHEKRESRASRRARRDGGEKRTGAESDEVAIGRRRPRGATWQIRAQSTRSAPREDVG